MIKYSDFENIESTLHIPNAKFHHFKYFFALFCCVTTTVFLTALLSTISHFSVLQAADARDSSKPAGLAKTAEKHGSSKVRNLNKALLTAKCFVALDLEHKAKYLLNLLLLCFHNFITGGSCCRLYEGSRQVCYKTQQL